MTRPPVHLVPAAGSPTMGGLALRMLREQLCLSTETVVRLLGRDPGDGWLLESGRLAPAAPSTWADVFAAVHAHGSVEHWAPAARKSEAA